MKLPTQGQRFRSLRDVEVGGLAFFAAPATGGFNAVLPAGEIVTVEVDPPDHATAVSARPDHYSELEDRLVPDKDRSWHNYNGYALVIDFTRLADDFEKLGDA